MAQTLAQTIKAKYPGKYDDISDADLESKVLAKYPGKYDDLPRTNAEKAAPGPGDPAFYGDPNDPRSQMEAGRHRGTAAAAGPSAAILGAGAGIGAAGGVLPFAVGAAKSAAGGYVGSRIADMIGVPKGVGAVIGSIAGPAIGARTIAGIIRGGTPKARNAAANWIEKNLAGQAAPAAEAAAATPAAAVPVSRSVTGMAPTAVPAPQTIGSMISTTVPAKVAAAASSPIVGKGAPVGRAFNTIWREFAKAAAPAAKKGERIWLKLGEDGIPVDVITPGQASRVPSNLKTWVARTW